MKTPLTTLCLTIIVFLGGCATDFQKGLTAAQSGDNATALREWTPLAEQGNAGAQYNLGVMYDKGTGVEQDYRTAVKWYRLAAEQRNADAQSNLYVKTCADGRVITKLFYQQSCSRAYLWKS